MKGVVAINSKDDHETVLMPAAKGGDSGSALPPDRPFGLTFAA